jgi:hypothetical protein
MDSFVLTERVCADTELRGREAESDPGLIRERRSIALREYGPATWGEDWEAGVRVLMSVLDIGGLVVSLSARELEEK